jgi:hypothetical protein
MSVKRLAPRGQSWLFDDIPLGYVHVFGAALVTGEDIRLFHDRFAPHLPLRADAPSAETPPAAQAHVYALWSRMLWERDAGLASTRPPRSGRAALVQDRARRRCP